MHLSALAGLLVEIEGEGKVLSDALASLIHESEVGAAQHVPSIAGRAQGLGVLTRQEDLLDDTLINEVSTTTQDDVASDADQMHLLDGKHGEPLLNFRLDEAHERAISNWKETEAAWARWFEENSDYLSELWGEG